MLHSIFQLLIIWQRKILTVSITKTTGNSRTWMADHWYHWQVWKWHFLVALVNYTKFATGFNSSHWIPCNTNNSKKNRQWLIPMNAVQWNKNLWSKHTWCIGRHFKNDTKLHKVQWVREHTVCTEYNILSRFLERNDC